MRTPVLTNDEARIIFDGLCASTQDKNQIAKIELCREYFCNPEFKKALEQLTWGINNPR